MSKIWTYYTILISLALFSIAFSLAKGSTPIAIEQLLFATHPENLMFYKTILWQIRLPRTLSAFVSGSLLGLSGTLIQVLLQNPLADPYVLGIASGAGFFTLVAISFGLTTTICLLSFAWLGSLLTIVCILLFARIHRFQSHSLLLTGIAIAYSFSAGITAILLLSPSSQLPSMLFWLTGDLSNTHLPAVEASILLAGFIICVWLSPGINILGRGDYEAKALGLATISYRLSLYCLCSLLTATAVTLSGCISFIGFITPHLARKLCGYDHRYVIPAAILLGGSLLTIADTIARTLFNPIELPVGIILAIIAIPSLLYLTIKKN
jgi:iron complex transport system permease protein